MITEKMRRDRMRVLHQRAAAAHRLDAEAQRAADEAADPAKDADAAHELAAKALETNRAAQHKSRIAGGLFPLGERAKEAVSMAANEEGEPFSAPSADLAAKEHDRLADLAAAMPPKEEIDEFDDDRR